MIVRVLLLLLVATASAFADSEEPTDPKAKAHWDRAEARYYAGDFAIAILEYKSGYAIEPKRIFLFALAQAERKSGNCAEGDKYARQFFATDLTEDQRKAAQELIDKVPCTPKEAPTPPPIKTTSPELPPPPPPAPPPPPVRPWFRDPLAGVVTGVGLATVAVGIGFGKAGSAMIEKASDAATLGSYDRRVDKGESRENVAKVMIPIGAALLAVGVVRYVRVGRATHERRGTASRVRPQVIGWLAGSGGGLGLAGPL
jgi:hypothetical protein